VGYDIQLWDTASNSNIEILDFKTKSLELSLMLLGMLPTTVHHDLNVPYVRDEIRRHRQIRRYMLTG